MKVLRLAAMSAVLAGSSAIATAQAYVRVGPPIFRREFVPPSRPGYIWQPGYHRWDGERYVWVPGVYVAPPRPGVRWVPGRWHRGFRGFHWVEGRWA